ncbi:MAG TPA: type I methionyl aminopeptidase [Candidatus Paceibacterota bacterium]|nr:type I methionyl aminopeptidase [Candidatus Paceibacterota bacterium]
MINLYTKEEIKIMRQGGRILAKIIKEIAKHAKPGITTKELDKVAQDLIFSYGAKPAFKGFNNYPAVLCASINEEIVHAVPSNRKLKQGDLLTLDLGIKYKNYCTDMAITLSIGKTDQKFKKLIAVTKKSLEIAIKQCKSGKHLGDIGWVIQNYVEKKGFNVIRDLVGHGIGKNVHEDPQILNYSPSTGLGIKLEPGMVLAIEPMIIIGDWEIEKTEDGFGFRSKDRSISAHFEHTIAITKKGAKILTK